MFNTKINFDEVIELSYGKLPDGKYLAIIDSIQKSMWANPIGGGKAEKLDITYDQTPEDENTFIEFRYQIIESEFAGRMHFDSLYLWAENETRRNISRNIFKKICSALNKDPASCTFEQLTNKPLYIILKTSKCGKYINVTNVEKHIKAVPNLNHNAEEDIAF